MKYLEKGRNTPALKIPNSKTLCIENKTEMWLKTHLQLSLQTSFPNREANLTISKAWTLTSANGVPLASQCRHITVGLSVIVILKESYFCLIKANSTLLQTLPSAVLKDYEELDNPYLINEETKLHKYNHTSSITTLISDTKIKAKAFFSLMLFGWTSFLFGFCFSHLCDSVSSEQLCLIISW